MSLHFTVLGAGAVGTCSALDLLRAGRRVTLVDRDEPGRGASFGNAGIVQTSGVVPIATTGVLKKVPGMLFDPDQPLVIRWKYLPRLLPYLTRFVASAAPARVEEVSIALRAILEHALPAWQDILGDAGASSLLRHTGELYVYESDAAYRAALPAHDLRRKRGVRVEYLDAAGLQAREPALQPTLRHGILLPDTMTVADPYKVIRHLAQTFIERGGEFLQAEVQDIEMGEHGPKRLLTSAGPRDIDQLVIATGAFSRRWAALLGAKIPLDTERGYHLTLPNPGVRLGTSLISGDFRFAVSSLDSGLRFAGTAELADVDAPPDYERAWRLLPLGRRILRHMNPEGATPWMGRRPSTPDSLPVIGRVPGQPSVILAFGHGHLGLTMGAVTGRIVADLASNRELVTDLAPFSSARFG